MHPLGHILVVVDPGMRPSAATRRAVELARRSGARLHLCMPAFDRRIEESAELVDPDVSALARENFIGQRRAWLTQWMAALADQGIRADGDVLWGPASHDAAMAKVLVGRAPEHEARRADRRAA
jgi:universal stress protein E